ncbi:MAG: PqiC family protein [Pseudomonadota bacterium]
MKTLRNTGLLLAMIALAGCASAPNPTLYMLPAPLGDGSSATRTIAIGLAEVELPAYARSSLIASADSEHRVRLDDNHRWASPPSEALTRGLAVRLENQLQADVLVRPYPREFVPALVIEVSFDELLRSTDGAATMRGKALLVHARDRDVTIVRFEIHETPSGNRGYEGFMAAIGAGLTELASRISATIDANPRAIP